MRTRLVSIDYSDAGMELFREFVPASITLCSDIVELDNNEDIVISDII